jgi:cadmium resistance protein CadD (predicted permease)
MLELPRTRRWAAWERVAAWHVFFVAFVLVGLGVLALLHRGSVASLGHRDLFATALVAAVVTARWRVLCEP